MKQQLTIEPISRIEGHGKITLILDDAGQVVDARFHVTQFRGFEKFCEGRPFTEMVSLTERICGICPISHSLASARACDAILGVRVPEVAVKLRRLLNCGAFIQSHALSFFYLSAPDLLLGMDSDPAKRNIVGMLEAYPEVMRNGITLRKIGQQVIETIAGKRIHPSWVVPGGVNAALSAEKRDGLLTLVPEALDITRRTLELFKKSLGSLPEEISSFANFPSCFMGLVDERGNLEHVDGRLRIIDDQGALLFETDPGSYQQVIGEAVEPHSYLKSPYYLPLGYPDGMYRVGPAARLNVCNGCGTPLADEEWAEFRKLAQGPVLSSFYNHYARLIEILYSIETMERLLRDPDILSDRVRAVAFPNYSEGIGVVEAPRGTLFHHYRVDRNGLITWANLIVATGNNNLAINRGVLQVAQRFVKDGVLTDGAANRIQAVVRAFDPCLSCSTHALATGGPMIELIGGNTRHSG